MSSEIRSSDAFDPIELEVMWSHLIAIADEMAATLIRTSFSTILRESNDYACGLLDAGGRSMADNTQSIPSFVGTLSRTCREMLREIPPRDLAAGDVLVTNDPWLGTGHLPDLTMFTPIFHRGRLAAFAGMIAHMPDVGGAVWSADAQEVFEEGLRIPPCKLIRAEAWNEEVVRFIRANSRVPDLVMGDIQALVAAGETASRRLVEFMDDRKIEDLGPLAEAIQGRAEAAMRRAIAALPDGVYRAQYEADGFDTPTRIVTTITVRGSDLSVDYTGTSAQINRGLNVVMNYTFAYTAYPLKCALDPFTPKNEGSFRPFTITAPEGCILNARFPAPVNARQLTGHLLSCAIYAALAPAMPDRIVADSGSCPSTRAVFSGRWPDGRKFSFILFANGGMGARPMKDGLSCTPFPTNSTCASIEVMENLAPLLVWRKALLPDSGGAGRFRGGLGQEAVIEVRATEPIAISLLTDRRDHPAQGFLGGLPGSPVRLLVNETRAPHPKARGWLQPKDRLLIRYGGGGGFGPPQARDRAAVQEDLAEGYITPDAARRLYGLKVGVPRPAAAPATRRAIARRRPARPSSVLPVRRGRGKRTR